MEGQIVVLCTLKDLIKISRIQQRLEEEGIRSQRIGEHSTSTVVENMSQAIQLMINSNDLPVAQQILEDEFGYTFDREQPKNFWEALKKGVKDSMG